MAPKKGVIPSRAPKMSRTAKAQIKLMQGTYSSEGEIRDWTYYDTERLNSTVSQYTYFVNGVGSPYADNSSNKTRADTNIITKGIPNAQNFEIKAMKVIYKPLEIRTEAEMVAMMTLLQNMYFDFKIANKDNTIELNLLDMMGLNFPVTQAAAVVGQNPIRSVVTKAYPLNVSIPLAAVTTYRGILTAASAVPAELVGDKLMICLQGYLQSLS